MARNRWRQELRKPRSEGGATICEKHDFALEHYSDPEMGYEVGEALRQAKDDGERMEKRIQELGEEANNLQEVLEEAEKELEIARKALAEAIEQERDALLASRLPALKPGEVVTDYRVIESDG